MLDWRYFVFFMLASSLSNFPSLFRLLMVLIIPLTSLANHQTFRKVAVGEREVYGCQNEVRHAST
jgi:hypothetical protein